MKIFSVLLVIYLLCILFNNRAFAQISKCPYEYFSLRTYSLDRNYFSFNVRFKDDVRLAYGTFSDLELFYSKFKDSKMTNYSNMNIVHELSSGFVLKSLVPLDSLVFFGFASTSQIRETEIIARKGEKYFINYYFNEYGGIKKDFDGYEAAIMKYLQLWCIAAAQDDESGYMHISYKFSQLLR